MTKYNRLAANIPAIYQPQINKFIRGLLEAWGTGDDAVEAAIAATKDQLFVETASGDYLDKLGSNVGVVRPSSIGMQDTDFRDLVPALSFAPKQLRDVIWRLLKVFYGAEAVFANFLSTEAEPYALADGDTLSFVIDRSTEIDITFRSADFGNIAQATAIEVANAINKQALGTGALADEYNDGVAKKKYVRVLTTTPGPLGEIRIAGGTAQNILKFPLTVPTTQVAGTEWRLTRVVGDLVRVEWTGSNPSTTNPNLIQVSAGDLVIVSGAFAADNQGSFAISKVGIGEAIDGITPGHEYTGEYIEISNATAVTETVTQTAALDVAFYTPKRYNITALARPAVLYEVEHKKMTVIIPSTSAVVSRDLRGAAHMHPNVELKLGTFDNVVGPEFVQGDVVYGIDALYLTNRTVAEFEDGETVTGASASAQIFKVNSNVSDNVILFVKSATGSFVVGESVTGSVSGAVAEFVTLISTTGGSFEIDAVLDKGRRYAVGNLSGTIQAGEGLVGRSMFSMEYQNGSFIEGETVTTAGALHLIAPFTGVFTAGEVLSGSFTPGSTVTGLSSGATGIVDIAVLSSGNTATIDKLMGCTTLGTYGRLGNETGTFTAREILIGSTSGNRGIVGRISTALATMVSTDDDEVYSSPYIFDIHSLFTAGLQEATLNQTIDAGAPITIMTVDPLPTDFPEGPGYFMLEYGSANQEGPIKYLARPGTTALVIDPSHIFAKTHAVGASVRYIESLEGTKVSIDGLDYAAYATGLVEARMVLQEFVRSVVAAGVVVNFVITFPEYDFESYNTNDVI